MIEKKIAAFAVAGQDRFQFTTPLFSQGAELYFLVHDLTQPVDDSINFLKHDVSGCDFSKCKKAYLIGTHYDIYKEYYFNQSDNQTQEDALKSLDELKTLKFKNKSQYSIDSFIISNIDELSLKSLYDQIGQDISGIGKNQIKAIFIGRGGSGKTTTARNLAILGGECPGKIGIDPNEKMTPGGADIFVINYRFD